MSETAPHPAESAPIGQPIEVFMADSPAEQVEVLQLPTTFDEAVDKFAGKVPPHHEKALELKEPDSWPTPEDGTARSMDVVTQGSTRKWALRGLVGAAALSAAIAVGAPHRVSDALKSENTGPVAAERDAEIDRKAKSIVVNSMQGSDGPVEVRVK